MTPTHTRPRSRRPWLLAAVALLAVAAVIVVVLVRHNGTSTSTSGTTTSTTGAPHPSTSVPSGPVPSTSTSFTVSGNRILADGNPYTPYGITVFGLSTPNWQSQVGPDEQQIAAIADTWHGNTARIQVSPPNLFSSSPYDAAYLAAIKAEVGDAQSHGLVVILTAQYQRSGSGHTRMPQSSTLSFWRLMAPIYAHDSRVWFDLFNEPKLPRSAGDPAGNSSAQWHVWRDGGSGDVGMQTMLDAVRTSAPHTLVLAEGLDGAKTLSGLPGNELSGSGVVYAVHPYFEPGFTTPAEWSSNWGDLSSSVPVLADEWGESENGRANCQTDAPTLVPTFLSYLASHQIGLIAWSLIPNVLVTGSSLTQPTTFTPGVAYVCPGRSAHTAGATSATKVVANGQGAGTDVLTYFAGHSRPPPAA